MESIFAVRRHDGRVIRILMAVVASLVILGTVYAMQTKPTYAVTPPDSCFAFNAATKTITDYYDNQANNPNNPACPRAVDIPATIGGVEVTEIGYAAFFSKSLTSVQIPDVVLSIGEGAFQSNSITSLELSNSVKSIGGGSFYYNSLTSLEIPDSVEHIGSSAFSSNELTSLVLGSSVESIGEYAFAYNKLSSITVPVSVKSIGGSAFENNKIKSIVIDGEITEIGSYVLGFINKYPIEKITYNGTLAYDRTATNYTYAESCFSFESGEVSGYTQTDDILAAVVNGAEVCGELLGNLTIPGTIDSEAVTSIGEYAFSDSAITSLHLPNSIAHIGEYAFANNQLNSVKLGSSLEDIGLQAFAFNNIRSVHLPDSVVSVEPTAFRYQGTSEAESDSSKTYYTRLYTANPDITSSVFAYEGCIAYDEDWDCLENGVTNEGGYIVNPSPLTLNFKSTNGDNLKPSKTYTGTLDGEYLTDYLAANGPDIPATEDFFAPTPAEQTAIDQALLAYYRIGDEVTITPPSVEGYITPAAKTFTLEGFTAPTGDTFTPPNTVGNFIYKKILTKVDFSKPSGSTSNPTSASVPAGVSPAMANSTFTVDTAKECSAIDTARLLPASDFTAPDATYTTLGGLDFTLSCTEPGKEASVSLSLGTRVAEPSTLKIYKQTAGNKVTDITNQTTITNQAGKTTISYNLTDGGALDDDGTVNGEITDPVFITVPADSELLADTGESQQVIVLLAVATTIIGLGLVYVSRKSAARG